MSARPEEALETPVRIRKPAVEKRPWRTEGSPEEARQAQILIRMAARKG